MYEDKSLGWVNLVVSAAASGVKAFRGKENARLSEQNVKKIAEREEQNAAIREKNEALRETKVLGLRPWVVYTASGIAALSMITYILYKRRKKHV